MAKHYIYAARDVGTGNVTESGRAVMNNQGQGHHRVGPSTRNYLHRHQLSIGLKDQDQYKIEEVRDALTQAIPLLRSPKKAEGDLVDRMQAGEAGDVLLPHGAKVNDMTKGMIGRTPAPFLFVELTRDFKNDDKAAQAQFDKDWKAVKSEAMHRLGITKLDKNPFPHEKDAYETRGGTWGPSKV